MTRCVIVKNGVVINTVAWDKESEFALGEGESIFDHDIAGVGDNWPYVEKQVVESESDKLKSQIAVLEASITPRRIREAVLSTEGETWLKGVNDQIAVLRGQLS